jgi:hypothetical protein
MHRFDSGLTIVDVDDQTVEERSEQVSADVVRHAVA